ncbi:hypothetical protein [Pseudactinotalea sp. Z1748]|uniref:hypothetical protein n=1 Tax=Pseudactinotalea sp. Z1748 TaxID=3413027 RepID=UPI003C7CB14A
MSASQWLLWATLAICIPAMFGMLTWRRNPDPSPDDTPPTAHAEWTCPDCRQTVPIAIVTERVVVARLDPTDVHAHLLQHQEAR